jgi:hypothetical protein
MHFVNFPASKVHTTDAPPRTLPELRVWMERQRAAAPRVLEISDTPEYSVCLSDPMLACGCATTDERGAVRRRSTSTICK